MKHLILIAWGNLRKSTFTTLLNLVGLISAFATFMLIMLYVWNEYHFDGFQKNKNEIYQLGYKIPDSDQTNFYMYGPTGQTLCSEFPDFKLSTTYIPWGKYGEQKFSYEITPGTTKSTYEDYAFADENLPRVFTFNFIHSSGPNPLDAPESAIVTESFAQKIWGNNDPIGKTLELTNSSLKIHNVYTITAVFKDLPKNSIFGCPIIIRIPSSGWLAESFKTWDMYNFPQFVLTKPGSDRKYLEKLINEQSIVRSKYKFLDRGKTVGTLFARPISDLHFQNEKTEMQVFESNNKTFVDSLLVIGILILLIAIINFINFTIAQIPMRLKTFSISRIIGCGPLNAVYQLLTETLSLFFAAFVLGMVVAWFVNQNFSVMVLGYKLPVSIALAYSFLIITIMGIFSGVYTAVVLISANPIQKLKQPTFRVKSTFKNVLTVFQFAATIALIVVSMGIFKQIRYMENADMGFDKGNMLVINLNPELGQKFETFRNKLMASPHIKQIACSLCVPGQVMNKNGFDVNGKNVGVWDWPVDDQYMDMMGFKIVDGRSFIKGSETEDGNYICNEAAANAYGWKVGDKLRNGQLVGIMKDFNLVSLRENVDPFVFSKVSAKNNFRYASIKFSEGHNKEVLSLVQKVYNGMIPSDPLRAFFLDDHLNLLYINENQQARLISFFSLLSVIVSVLGTLGLSIFLCQRKAKEIGIRKVNGAQVTEIMKMLNRDFVKWVIVAFIIASPISWLIMYQWLEGFAFKTIISWWIFPLAGLMALGIALLTVSWQSWKVATRNPVEALRYE